MLFRSQEDAIAAITGVATKAKVGIASLAQTAAEQVAAVEQMVRSTNQIRGRAREIASSAAQQGKRAVAVAEYADAMAERASQIVSASREQLAFLSAGPSRNGEGASTA